MIRTTFGLALVSLAVLLAADGRASLYHPDTDHPDNTGVVPVDDAGAPTPLPFGEFQRRRVILQNVGLPDGPLELLDPNTKQMKLTDRGVVDARIKKARAKGTKGRTEAESVALAVDLLRFGRPDDAQEALRGLPNGFLPNITLAHISIAQDSRDRPGWERADDYLDFANSIAKAKPPVIRGVSAQNLAWQLKLDRGALAKLVRNRMKESRDKPPPETELPDQLWPVKFVNDAGQYEPGALAAAEKAKLPEGDFREAIATVQQLVLWFPADVRLYWLLGELYAARGEKADAAREEKGDLDAALEIMNKCVESGRYSNRKVLMDHRELVSKAAQAAQAAQAAAIQLPVEANPPVPFSMGAVWIYFGVVGVVALFALVRAVTKKGKGSGGACGPVG